MVRRLVLAALALVLLGAGWLAWRAWHVREDLVAASASATALRTALTDGDQTAADRELATLQQHASAAAEGTDTAIWSVAEHLPVVGDDATAVAVVSSAMADLSRDGLPPIVHTAGRLDAGTFAPKDGRLPLAGLSGLQRPVTRASSAFARAERQLAGVETSGLTGTVSSRYDDLAEKVGDATEALGSARRAVRLLPPMLGADGERRYLLVFENNAEIRATGGMPGAMSLVVARDGQMELTQQLTAGDFPHLAEPVLPLTEEERAIFGENLGTYAQDVNFTPDFPRAAELLAAHWAREHDTPLNGVVSVDPVALSYVLAVTGPVTVDGITLTADNVVEELLNNTYLRLADPADQDAFFRDVAREVFTGVTSGAGAPADLLRALSRGVDEGRLKVHSFDAAEQRELTGTAIAGEFPSRVDDRPQVAVTLNDATGSKMSYYLDYQVEVTPTSCQDGTQELQGRLTMTSNAPENAADLPTSVTGGGLYGVPRGAQIVVADLFAPDGGTISGLRLDGAPSDVVRHTFQGRPMMQVPLYLESGQSAEVAWTMTTDQTGDTDVRVTPGVAPERESSVVASACS